MINVLANWSVNEGGDVRWYVQEKRRRNFRGQAAPLGASRRVRAGELLESRGKARSNSTTAAGHGEHCCRGALRVARGPLTRRARVRGASACVLVERRSADAVTRGQQRV